MSKIFKVKIPLGRSYNVDLDDTLRAKKALQRLGYYSTPKSGLTQHPDETLFRSIERFQKNHDLRKDGVMKPGGETESAIRHNLNRMSVRANEKALNTTRLFNAFDAFRKLGFHAEGSAESTKCCASGTCDISS